MRRLVTDTLIIAERNIVRLPRVGKVSVSKVAGAAAFLLVLAWWLSPWAPIHAG